LIGQGLIDQNLAFAAPGDATTAGGFVGIDLDYRITKSLSLFAAGEGTLMTDHSAFGTLEGGVRVAF
jgi:hypothetical protein